MAKGSLFSLSSKDRVPGLSVQPLDLAGTMSASPSSTVGAVSIGGGAAGAAAKEQNPNLFTSTGGTSISSGSQSARTAVTSPAPVSKVKGCDLIDRFKVLFYLLFSFVASGSGSSCENEGP